MKVVIRVQETVFGSEIGNYKRLITVLLIISEPPVVLTAPVVGCSTHRVGLPLFWSLLLL